MLMRPPVAMMAAGLYPHGFRACNPKCQPERRPAMAADYVPPVQKGFGQLVDSIFLLVLVYCSLLAPLLLKTPDKPPEAETAKAHVTWKELGQNPAMEAQWRKLGYDAQQAKPIITSRFDYQIEPVSLIVTALVIVGYFVFVLRVSEKQYRQVIAEKFGETS
jgi:hypothetical protein